VNDLLESYRRGTLKPSDAIASVYERVGAEPLQPVWIRVVDRETALARARRLESGPRNVALPLYGIPFAVKDNIDVAGIPTTAACPEFAYTPERHATAVQRLLDAGAILIGKTNMDQFATGLVGTRSPYGACSSVFSERHISGGSSSGSAVAVAKGLVGFSLGTDTAGSGRVPAAFNNLVGMKPTPGAISTAGVVPACRSLDCVSIFARTAAEARVVWEVLCAGDEADPYSRQPDTGSDSAPWTAAQSFRFGYPRPEQLEFFGDQQNPKLYESALERLQSLGGEPVEIDFEPFRKAAQLLYCGPWVAERFAAVGRFIQDHPNAVHPVVGRIINGGKELRATDAFEGMYQLRALRHRACAELERADFLALPTAPTVYTVAEVVKNPVELNSNLGYYTNFVNLLDLAAVAVPAGFRRDGMPFGVTFAGRAWSDAALLALAQRYLGEPAEEAATAPGCVEVAVVGAHLSGMPLNRELTCRRARLLRACRTAPHYRLYALPNTTPPKPGLRFDPAYHGRGIEVEVWAVSEREFGSFVAGIPAPLGIGTVTLDDGSQVKCFICEGYALNGAREITEFGGWRNFLQSLAATA
jgi:allophanate hydrolase